MALVSKYESDNGTSKKYLDLFNNLWFYREGLKNREIMTPSNRTLEGEIAYCDESIRRLEEAIAGLNKHFVQYRANGRFHLEEMALGTVSIVPDHFIKNWDNSENALHMYDFEYGSFEWARILDFAYKMGMKDKANDIVRQMATFGFRVDDGSVTNGTDTTPLKNTEAQKHISNIMDNIVIDNTIIERKAIEPKNLASSSERCTISDNMKDTICKVYRFHMEEGHHGTCGYIERFVKALGYELSPVPWKNIYLYNITRNGEVVKGESVHISAKALEELGKIHDECETFTNHATFKILEDIYRVCGLI